MSEQFVANRGGSLYPRVRGNFMPDSPSSEIPQSGPDRGKKTASVGEQKEKKTAREDKQKRLKELEKEKREAEESSRRTREQVEKLSEEQKKLPFADARK